MVTYVVKLLDSGTTAPDQSGRHVKLPIQLGARQNDHYPVFYFYVGILCANGDRFGTMRGGPLEDEYQHAGFWLGA